MQDAVSRRTVVLAALGATLSLTACKIVRDSDKAAATDPSDPNNFDAKAYVGAMWDRKVVTYFDEHAHPIEQVLTLLAKDKDAAGAKYGHRAGGEGSPWTFAVRGTGVVKSVDTASHHGEMVVQLQQPGKAVDATLQIGPVIFGTAVRDTLPFVGFGDFQNQIQYAEVSRALNDRAAGLARTTLSPPPRRGTVVAFLGAMIDPALTGDTTITAVRVRPARAAAK
jgi:predicted lipoprotein